MEIKIVYAWKENKHFKIKMPEGKHKVQCVKRREVQRKLANLVSKGYIIRIGIEKELGV